MQEILDNKVKEKPVKKRKKRNKKERERINKIISLSITLTSIIILLGLTIWLIINNMYKTGAIGDYDSNYTVQYNDFLTKKDNVYYVYFYIDEDANCKDAKSMILSYQRGKAQTENAPLYTFEVSKNLSDFLNIQSASGSYASVANLVGVTRDTYKEAKLGDVPCLALVRRQDGMQTIMSYVVGKESIDAQLKLSVNYEKYLGD